ncbi:MAG: hypothetical protein R3C03_23915 [Pirellulaceae bacterium]
MMKTEVILFIAFAAITAFNNLMWFQDVEVAAKVQQVDAETGETVVVMLDSVLRAACLTGAFLGAILHICFWPIDEETSEKSRIRRVGIKFIASAIVGVVGTPTAIMWLKWPINFDRLIFVSATIAFLGVAVIHTLARFRR